MWMMLLAVVVAWLLWVFGGVIGVEAEKRQGKRPPDAGFSPTPIVPFVPLLMIGVAWLIDQVAPPWGTQVVGGVHVLLIAAFLIAIIHQVWRMRQTDQPRA